MKQPLIVSLTTPIVEKEITLYEIVGEITEKTNEVIDKINTPESRSTLAAYGITDAYTKTETDTKLATKADKSTTLEGYGITDAYTKAVTDTALAAKADDSTTLAGYGITDAYTKTEIDTSLAGKMGKTGDQTLTGKLTTNSGAAVVPAEFIDDNGKITVLVHPTVNAFQSSNLDGTDKPFSIEGYNGTNISKINLKGTLVNSPGDFTENDVKLSNKYAAKVHTHLWGDLTDKPTTFPPPVMSGSVVGGAQVGNGLGMSGNYLYLKALRGLKIDSTDNAVVVDRAVTDAWYQLKGSLALTNITSFSNGWTHLTGRELKYAITGDNMLWLNGIVDGAAATTSATGTVIATLPAGVTPKIAARAVVGLTGDLQGMIDVNTNGTITIVANFTGVASFKGWASINITVPLV